MRERLKRLVERIDRPMDGPIRLAGWAALALVILPPAAWLAAPKPEDRFASQVAPAPDMAPLPPEESAHLPMPEEVRGVYLTSYTAASKPQRDRLIAYAKRNGLNAVVIDVKDPSGLLAFMPEREPLQAHKPEKATIEDLDAVLEDFRAAGLYRIARIFVFQDPTYVKRFPHEAVQRQGGGVWADYKGVTWADPASRAVWDYNAELAREAYGRGFDEIQFDYIRFPSDGNMSTVRYRHYDGASPKREIIGAFFRYMHRELQARGIPVSYDLFGFVTWHTHDLSIGQMLVDVLPYGTAISAMVYPSHYPPGTIGFSNPADHPYEIVADSLRRANELYAQRDRECAELAAGTRSATSAVILPCGKPLAHHRPWLQAFDLGATYDAAKIEAQIRAVRDQGGKGWLLWNARNVYRDFDVAAPPRKETPAGASQ
jgi:hypothetical protein